MDQIPEAITFLSSFTVLSFKGQSKMLIIELKPWGKSRRMEISLQYIRVCVCVYNDVSVHVDVCSCSCASH